MGSHAIEGGFMRYLMTVMVLGLCSAGYSSDIRDEGLERSSLVDFVKKDKPKGGCGCGKPKK